MHSTQNKDDEAVSLAGVSASSPARRSGQTVIQVFSQRPAAAQRAEADAIEPDGESSFVSIGSIAVRLLADWSLPRIVCRSMAWEEGTPTGAEEDH